MKKKKILILATIVCMIFVAVFIISLENNGVTEDKEEASALVSVQQAIETYASSIENTSYTNLIFHDFNVSIESVESLYNIKILTNNDYQNRTFLEEFSLMNKIVDDFFKEDFDKSYLEVTFFGTEGSERIPYSDVLATCSDEKYDAIEMAVLFGNNTAEGGYMVQVSRGGSLAWFSRNGFGGIHPSICDYKHIYKYLQGMRQSEDVEINLKDGKIKLSNMEENVLSYLSEGFPLDVNKDTTFTIGDVRVIDLGDYDGLCFKVRRVYKGIPFEYANNASAGIYIDPYGHDQGEIAYVESTRPDTMLSFESLDGTIVETEVITEMLPINKALDILSEKIGDNSRYDVYGIELVYRECYTSEEIEKIEEEEKEDISEILKPMWKVITVNQNDDKYTLFYIDVVTGDITERFEYYYE